MDRNRTPLTTNTVSPAESAMLQQHQAISIDVTPEDGLAKRDLILDQVVIGSKKNAPYIFAVEAGDLIFSFSSFYRKREALLNHFKKALSTGTS